MPDFEFAPTTALPEATRPARFGRPDGSPGVTVVVRDGASCIQAMPWRGRRAGAAGSLAETFGASPPNTPGVVRGEGKMAIVWSGPDAWMLVDPAGGVRHEAVKTALSEDAAIVEQSDARVLIELRGPHVPDVLAKGMDPDFHEKAFPVGTAAIGKLCHMTCQVWRCDDHFGLLVPRPAIGDVWHWLIESALEFGIEIVPEAKA